MSLNISRRTNLLLTFLTSILLFAAWPMSPFTFLIFGAWVPLLIVESNTQRTMRFFAIAYLNMLIWNVSTTWWVWNASEGGAAGAFLANSLLMTIPWLAFRFTKKQLGPRIGYISLVLYWLTFEYIHHNWGLSWPWLTLGNVFATHPEWVRWYAYTGTTGGSLWVWLVNLLCFAMIISKKMYSASSEVKNIKFRRTLSFFVTALSIPVIFSFLISTFTPLNFNYPLLSNVVVVQPNIDPYKEKFSTDVSLQIEKLIRLSESQIDNNTRMVVWPETAVTLPSILWESDIRANPYYQPIFAFAKRHPQIMLVTGIDSYINYQHENPGGFSIRHDKGSDVYWEAFNTAMGLDSNLNIQLYHKSKLVPGVESLPSWLGFLGKWFEDFGGTSGTLGSSKEPMELSTNGNPYKAAPVICYESIYSEYVTEYIKKGANVITVITNDGWWGNTPGYHQHQNYARLRAIETGTWIARSANTGISCFISPAGEVFDAQPWDKEAAIKMAIPTTSIQTFYVKHGDWISRIAWILAGVVLLWAFVIRVLAFHKRKK